MFQRSIFPTSHKKKILAIVTWFHFCMLKIIVFHGAEEPLVGKSLWRQPSTANEMGCWLVWLSLPRIPRTISTARRDGRLGRCLMWTCVSAGTCTSPNKPLDHLNASFTPGFSTWPLLFAVWGTLRRLPGQQTPHSLGYMCRSHLQGFSGSCTCNAASWSGIHRCPRGQASF